MISLAIRATYWKKGQCQWCLLLAGMAGNFSMERILANNPEDATDSLSLSTVRLDRTTVPRDDKFQFTLHKTNRTQSSAKRHLPEDVDIQLQSFLNSVSLDLESQSIFLANIYKEMALPDCSLYLQFLQLQQRNQLFQQPFYPVYSYLHPYQLLGRPKRKGGQVRFTNEQTKNLESTFQQNQYISPTQRKHIANQLKLQERQVKTWFQNRRAKQRKSTFGAKEMNLQEAKGEN